MAGRRIAHYEIEKQLGAGGMGVVYLGRDTVLDRRAAIKLLQQQMVSDEVARTRFLREARAIAALNHPSIAILFEFGEHEGAPFLAMEYVEGKSLRQVIAGAPLEAGEWLEYASQLVSALQHAHSHGVLHRDIKSSNIVLTPSGTAKLLDFGLAVFHGETKEEDYAGPVTQPGTWVGTLQYAPPEVISGGAADARSDIYSLGVVLYEMACGQLPFTGVQGSGLAMAILRGDCAPLSKKNPQAAPEISQVVERAMAPDPADRFVDAAELNAAISGIRNFASTQTMTVTQVFRPPVVPSVAVLEFQNIARDPEVDWLGTGIAETLISDLRKIRNLQIIAPERVRAAIRASADPANPDLRELGRALQARWIIGGSFQRAGARLRITPRMEVVATGEIISSGKLDGSWDDVFELQDRVTAAVIAAFQVQVDSSTEERIADAATVQMQAFEQYSLGRRQFNQMGRNALEEARQCFQRALASDPDYALAHSGLGATYAMRYIHRTDPNDLAQAIVHLERAVELDSKLAEPFSYLCYVYMRKGMIERALAAGRKAIERQPDLVQAHYFLGAAYMASAETVPTRYAESAAALLKATELEPEWVPSWLILSEIAICLGQYDLSDEFIGRFRELLENGMNIKSFIGAELLQGTVLFRRGRFADAADVYRGSIAALSGSDHVYANAFRALSHCGLGDIGLREDDIDQSLAEYSAALEISRENRLMLGGQRVEARALAGLAAARAAAGDSQNAEELLEEASALLGRVQNEPQTWIWQASLSQLFYSSAVAWMKLGVTDGCLKMLGEAVRSGWGDARWLVADPTFKVLQGHMRFEEVVSSAGRLGSISLIPVSAQAIGA
jgi:serine/threonine protein kinase/tetratricopeptide (TPR) repeat protein